MMRYPIEPRDLILAKDYGILSFAKNISKNSVKTEAVNTARNNLLNNLPQMRLKLLQIEQFQKLQKQLVI